MIELLLSISILTIGLLAVMALFVSSIRESMDSRNQVIAAEMVQEGIELVRNLRDTNIVLGTSAFDNFPNNDSNNCRIDYMADNLGGSACNSSSNSKDIYLNANNFYDHNSSGNPTRFKRKIMVTYDTSSASTAAQAEITGLVIWGDSNIYDFFPANCTTASKCVYARTILVVR